MTEIGMALANGSLSISYVLLYSIDLDIFSNKFLSKQLFRLACAISMGFGVYFSGDWIIKKMGTQFWIFTHSAAFCAQFTTLLLKLVCSLFGYPVSSTQIFVFALLGLDIFNKKPTIVTMNRLTIVQFVIWWLMTTPACIAAPYLCCLAFRNTIVK